MKRDDLRLFAGFSSELPIPIRDVAVRRAMESVTSHSIAAVQLIRNRVDECALWQRVMKGRVEYGYLRYVRSEDCARSRYAAKIVRIMKRREIDEVFELAAHIVSHARRVREALSTMNETMSDCFYLADGCDGYPGLVTDEPRHYVFDRSQVIADRSRRFHEIVSRGIQCDDRLATNALDLTASKPAVSRLRDHRSVGIDKLKLDRGRADVENQYVHGARKVPIRLRVR